MLEKTWVGAVSYLNTKPLIYGFEQGEMANEVHLVLDYPAQLAARMNKGELDAALVPIAAMDSIRNVHIFSSYCIGANGPVASVCLFSSVPLDDIEYIYLDYQSRSSVALLKILLRQYWKKEVQFLDAAEGYIEKISGTTAGLIIGDRAFEQLGRFPFIFDLASAWKNYTGLPFVFAAWITNKPLSESFITAFNNTIALGFEHLDTIIAQQEYAYYDLRKYYFDNISYTLDARKHEAIALFRKYLKTL